MRRRVILVPRRSDGGLRDKLWSFCRKRWETAHPDLEIVEGHHDVSEGKFNRSMAINRAAAAAGDFDLGIIIDSDVIIDADRVTVGIQLAERTGRLVFPFRVYQSLSQQASSRVVGGWQGDWAKHSTRAYWDSVSCVVITPRRLWDQVGGFDERFVGWGWEDTAFACATDCAAGGRLRLEGNLWHLWHPVSPERPAGKYQAEYAANTELGHRYRNAVHIGWDAMEPLLSEPGGPLGTPARRRKASAAFSGIR